MWGYGPGWMMGYGGWGGGWIMLIWLVFLVLGVAAVFWLARAPGYDTRYLPKADKRSPGLDVLEGRYARGDINRDEYLQKKRDILGTGGSD